jgi:uncharacterized protein YukE
VFVDQLELTWLLSPMFLNAPHTVESHQRFQSKINRVNQEIEQQNMAVLEVVSRLREAERSLEDLLNEAHQKRKVMLEANKGRSTKPLQNSYAYTAYF